MIKEEDISEIYNKGLNDAWELAKKITNETFDYREKIFGYGYNSDVFSKFTPQTALEKIKANEIIIGDIVKVIDDSIRIAIVTQIMSRYVNVLFSDGSNERVLKEELEFTGKHVDIKNILEQLVI